MMVKDGDCGSKIEKKDTEGSGAEWGLGWTQTRTDASAEPSRVEQSGSCREGMARAAASDGEPAFPRAGKISKRVIGRKTRSDSGLKIGSRPRVLGLVPPRYHRQERFR